MSHLTPFVWLVLICLCSCGPGKTTTLSGSAMGTTWNIQITQPVADLDQSSLHRALSSELERVEAIFSTWRQDSEITRFNLSRTTKAVPVSFALAFVISEALRISETTDGAFDPTLGPLIDLWGFGKDGRRDSPPTLEAIQSARQRCGARHLKVSLDPPTLQKSVPDLQVNPSALVEGYAADQLGEWLIEQGYKDWLIEIGGEILARGNSLTGQPWKVGIQTPGADMGESISSIPLQNAALATSGTYRQRFSHGGRTYSHLLDPRTGSPVETRLVSVSVVGPSCLVADAYATALLILGREQGDPLARRLGLRVFWIQETEP